MTVIPLFDYSSDKWSIDAGKNLDRYTFTFDYFPNEWFADTTKRITKESFDIGKLSVGTLHRYNRAFEEFFKFCTESNHQLKDFSDLNAKIIEEYVHYLLMNVNTPSTRSVKLSALKFHLGFGQKLGWSGFPKAALFDGTENRVFQNTDSLKSMVIDDNVLKKIDKSIDDVELLMETTTQISFWGLITVIRHTGLRLHEALLIKEEQLIKDLTGKPLLEVLSTKTHTDRYIPINSKVKKAIKKVASLTKEVREEKGIEEIFVYVLYPKNPAKREVRNLSQKESRRSLRKFLVNLEISDPITFHQFRHTLGTDLLNGDMSMYEVMQYLGHESTHSTRLYAKIRKDRLSSEYKKLGFIGVIAEKAEDIKNEKGTEVSDEKRLMAQLPDGVCAKPINENVIDCKKPNACLFCPKFITTPEFLEIHKDHLDRIKADKQRYAEENLIGTDYLLLETEKALEEIISQLESLHSSKGGDAV